MSISDASAYENTHPGFEGRLVEQLDPIRGFVLASSLFHLFDLGIAEDLLCVRTQSVSEMAHRFDLNRDRLEGLLLFLQVEGFVQISGDVVSASQKLVEMREAWPWYEMLIGGYAQTYLDMGKGLRAMHGPLSRDGARVGSGSCKISHYDAIPLTRNLLAQLGKPPKKIVDLGCGNALYLKELCSLFPDLVTIGVEPDVEGHNQSAIDALASEHYLRIKLYNSTAQEFIRTTEETGVDAIIIAFVLQEILGQEGRNGTIAFLRQVSTKFPAAKIVVIEVDNKASDVEAMRHPLARNYYNPYYLVHYFTRQVIETVDFWIQLFADAGLGVLARSTTDPNVDSTNFELGFLLKSNDP
jgi:2-ketoarginine methyltransferase